MSHIPHILLLEDHPADAYLIEQELREAGFGFEFVCVASKERFERALAEFSPDLILADYSLPTYDGLSALRRAAEWNPNVPVIIVTGSLSEETAVDCMKAGATDYVLKERLSRLAPAAQRALERHRVWEEKARAERAMRISQARTRAILEAAIDGIVTTNTDGAIAEFNHAAEQIFGRERGEVVGHHFADMLVAAADRPRCQEQVMALLHARP